MNRPARIYPSHHLWTFCFVHFIFKQYLKKYFRSLRALAFGRLDEILQNEFNAENYRQTENSDMEVFVGRQCIKRSLGALYFKMADNEAHPANSSTFALQAFAVFGTWWRFELSFLRNALALCCGFSSIVQGKGFPLTAYEWLCYWFFDFKTC